MRRLYRWWSFCLQHNSSSLLLYVFTSSDSLVLKHHSKLQLSWLLNMYLRVKLLTSLNSSIVFFLFFFIMYPKYFLIWRASALVHPHCWALLSLTIENMCLATIFTRLEVSARNDGSRISSSSFPLDVFRTWPRTPIYGCFIKSHIVLSSSLTMKSTMKTNYIMHPLPFLI